MVVVVVMMMVEGGQLEGAGKEENGEVGQANSGDVCACVQCLA
jgi:hypothetical protein